MKHNLVLLIILLILTVFNMCSCCCCSLFKKQPKKIGDFTFSSAIIEGNIKFVKKFIEIGTDVNELIDPGSGVCNPPLFLALFSTEKQNRKEIITILIEKGANLNYKDKETGLSYLHVYSPLEYDYDIFKLLIEKGADVNSKDKYGKTPLVFLISYTIAHDELDRHTMSDYETGAFKEFDSKVNLLIEKGVKVDILNAIDDTPDTLNEPKFILDVMRCGFSAEKVNILDYVLNSALAESYLPELLIKKGADVKYKDNKGRTLLIRLVLFTKDITDTVSVEKISTRLDKAVELLVSKGVDINAQDNDHMSALDYAENMPELSDILKKYGAK